MTATMHILYLLAIAALCIALVSSRQQGYVAGYEDGARETDREWHDRIAYAQQQRRCALAGNAGVLKECI